MYRPEIGGGGASHRRRSAGSGFGAERRPSNGKAIRRYEPADEREREMIRFSFCFRFFVAGDRLATASFWRWASSRRSRFRCGPSFTFSTRWRWATARNHVRAILTRHERNKIANRSIGSLSLSLCVCVCVCVCVAGARTDHNRTHATDVLHAVFYLTSQPIPGFAVLPADKETTPSNTPGARVCLGVWVCVCVCVCLCV